MRILTLALSLPLLADAAAAQEGSVAIRAGTILTEDGAAVEDGTLVVVGGRISAVGGADVEVPFDVILHEHPEATVFSGFHEAHTSGGLDRANENVPIAPFLDVRDSIDPVSFFFEDELRNGTVALGVIPGNNCVIGGRGRVLAPAGLTVEEMTLAPGMGMKLSFGPRGGWSRGSQLAELREAMAALQDALERKGQELVDRDAERADRKKAGEEVEEVSGRSGNDRDEAGGFVRYGADFPGKSLISEEDVDEVQRGLVSILNGEERLWLWCPEPSDVLNARDWASEQQLLPQVVFVVSAACWKVADALQKAARPVVLQGELWHVERDPVTWEEKRKFAPQVFHDAGLSFAIGSEKGRMGPDRLAYQAAACVREGLPRGVALAAVTSAPAAAWGLQDRLGKLAVGADGSFVILDGDPLDAGSKVLEVWIRGRRVYERSSDERLQRLLEGKRP
ncbi:MAG: hypothetical protein EYC70_05415 [Planctomycetota bacterium]|nr:MAG: hypothetical protein EYC70_05415 [Planctomycetota bacterium]